MMCVKSDRDVCATNRLGGDRGELGFTLIEVLIAAFVLGLGVLGLAALFAGTARQQQLSSQMTRSTSIAQSAEAIVAPNVGKIGVQDCGPAEDAQIYPGQRLYPGEWFAVPARILGSSDPTRTVHWVSINPQENWSSGDAPFFRVEPNQRLPRLLYRAVPDNGEILVGKAGVSQTGAPQPTDRPFSVGAPAFEPEGAFNAVRVLADSIVIRVKTMGYGCTDEEGLPYRALDAEVPGTMTMTLHPDATCQEDSPLLLGSDGQSLMQVYLARDVSDDQLQNDPARITLMWIPSVWGGLKDINCDGAAELIQVEPGQGRPLYNDGGFSEVGEDRYDVFGANGAGSAYRLRPDGLTAELVRPEDLNAAQSAQIFVSGRGPFTTAQGPGAVETGIEVRDLDANWRFISEIWLDSFEYRGHRLVSASDRVWYTPDPSRPSGRRADVAYSLMYRDRGEEGGAQYIVFTYALRPSSASGEYVPPERPNDIASGIAPLKRVERVRLEFDDELLKYYVEVRKGSRDEWITTPGQILVFAGDGENDFSGADGPVKVQFHREVGTEVRGYLESPPRIGNRSLLDVAANTPGVNDRFNVWVVQPSVRARDGANGSLGSTWGLRPIEARVFDAFGS